MKKVLTFLCVALCVACFTGMVCAEEAWVPSPYNMCIDLQIKCVKTDMDSGVLVNYDGSGIAIDDCTVATTSGDTCVILEGEYGLLWTVSNVSAAALEMMDNAPGLTGKIEVTPTGVNGLFDVQLLEVLSAPECCCANCGDDADCCGSN